MEEAEKEDVEDAEKREWEQAVAVSQREATSRQDDEDEDDLARTAGGGGDDDKWQQALQDSQRQAVKDEWEQAIENSRLLAEERMNAGGDADPVPHPELKLNIPLVLPA